MSHAASSFMPCFGIGLAIFAGAASLADDSGRLKEAWEARLKAHKSVVYGAGLVRTSVRSQDQRHSPEKTQRRVQARMNCELGKLRFDCEGEGPSAANVFLLEGRMFHTCRRKSGGWEVASARWLEPGSPWLEVYPFLLAHGVVPLPPLLAPSVATSRSAPRPQERRPMGTGEATFEFPGEEPVAVTVTNNLEGLVSHYLVRRSARKQFEITNTYRREGGVSRLNRFQVVLFAPDGTATTVEGRVEQFRVDAPLPPELFTRPRASRELKQQLAALLDKTATVRLNMTADDLGAAIQAAVGRELPVRVDREAIDRVPHLNADALLRLEPGEAKLSDVLFGDLRGNFLDFRFDLQGITIIPRAAAWAQADMVEYSAADYGLKVTELRDLISNAALSYEDWSNVGGVASLMVDEQQGRISVFHAQSDHFYFQRRLDSLKRDADR